MSKTLQHLVIFSFILLFLTLLLGVIGAFAYLYPGFFNSYLPFYQLRPMHVSAALFWLLTGAVAGILFYKKQVFETKTTGRQKRTETLFAYLWSTSIVCVFCFYLLKKFGGREYWEFPPVLGIPILASWLLLAYNYVISYRKTETRQPLYVWMWSTGILFFLVTFLEQNLYHISWFRQSFLREVTVQWKSNGAMVGAWNQMIYGTSLFIMVKLAKDKSIATGKQVFFFYFLGLTNLMFNWGHHIYNLPTASWIRHVSYAISMTEWLIFINIIRGFKNKLSEQRKFKHLVSYRFLIASEYWVFLNLLLALMMSVPAINRYTHGTHITVAHAMGATIGINTMILLSSFAYMLKVDALPAHYRKRINTGFAITQVSLVVFWLALIAAGLIKGYRSVALHMENFQLMMQPVQQALHLFAVAGIPLAIGIGIILYYYLVALNRANVRYVVVTNHKKYKIEPVQQIRKTASI